MPIYEFDCKKCGAAFEKLVRNREEKVTCPECGARTVEKRFSLFGVQGGAGKEGSSSCGSCSATSCKGCAGE